MSGDYGTATSVHRLRPQDIKVVASLGDSITAANGAMAYSEEETRLNYRGVSAMGGRYHDTYILHFWVVEKKPSN